MADNTRTYIIKSYNYWDKNVDHVATCVTDYYGFHMIKLALVELNKTSKRISFEIVEEPAPSSFKVGDIVRRNTDVDDFLNGKCGIVEGVDGSWIKVLIGYQGSPVQQYIMLDKCLELVVAVD